MKATMFISLLLAALCQLSCAVTVTEGEYKFSLESVKELGVLMNGDDVSANHNLQTRAAAACANPSLPKDFQPLCQGKDAGVSLARLALVAAYSDACEICESVACTGC
ncbi:guanylin-like [Polymixia lowei]